MRLRALWTSNRGISPRRSSGRGAAGFEFTRHLPLEHLGQKIGNFLLFGNEKRSREIPKKNPDKV